MGRNVAINGLGRIGRATMKIVLEEPELTLVDLRMTQVIDGDLVNVKSWYDNEWGYACQMVRTVTGRDD